MHHTRFHLNPAYLPGGRLSGTRVQDNNLHLLDYQQPIAVNDSEEFIEVTIAIRDYFTTIKPCHYSWPDFIKDIIPRYILLCKYLITFIISVNYFYCLLSLSDFPTASSRTIQLYTGWPLTRNRPLEGIVCRRMLEIKTLLAISTAPSTWWGRMLDHFSRTDRQSGRAARLLQPYVRIYSPPQAFYPSLPRSEQMALASSARRGGVVPRTDFDRGDLLDLRPDPLPRPRGFPAGVPASPQNPDQLVAREMYRVMGNQPINPWQFL